MRYAYPYELSPQPEGGFTVTFPDVPEAITQGETEAEAAGMAEDALVTALSFYADDAEPLPLPSPARGRRLAYLPPLVAAKLALHDAMLAAGVSNVAISHRLGVDEKIVRRLRDPLHKSRIDQVGEALRTLGKIIEVVVRDAVLPEQHAAEASTLDHGSDNWGRPRLKAEVRPQLLCSKRRAQSRPRLGPGRVVTHPYFADAQRKRNQHGKGRVGQTAL
jgi:antitoxin HicB